ncbi:MAG: MotA/TolQ/ExbB proton channel family protein [Acidobacteria bacterium]|nr:MotA/TolQ/ExbB proton channel family protein [Acidobacteriota bacterium]
MAVHILLIAASCFSWGIIFTKWSRLRKARAENGKFLRAFRKASGFDGITAACEQFPLASLVTVYDYGFAEVDRQVRSKQRLNNRTAVERSLQIGAGEEIARLEQNMNWLATTAAITPFVGLFGTVLGIIDSFQALTGAGAASLRAVGPGIAEALIATAMGLFAAIPAAIFYNYFGFLIREVSARMEDFGLEFMNLIERVYEA